MKLLNLVVIPGLLLTTSILTSSALAVESSYKEGTHFVSTGEKKTEKVEIREYFSLFCPHCYSMESHMKKLRAELPSNVSFERSHVNFLAGSKETQDDLTMAYIYSQEKARGDDFVEFMFNRIHREKNQPEGRSDVVEALTDFGYSEKEANSVFSSFSVSSKQKMIEKTQNDLVNSRILDGVPSLIVNGQYKIVLSSLSKKDTIADLEKLIVYLNEKGK